MIAILCRIIVRMRKKYCMDLEGWDLMQDLRNIWEEQILADTFKPYSNQGADYAFQLGLSPLDLKMFRWVCAIPNTLG